MKYKISKKHVATATFDYPVLMIHKEDVDRQDPVVVLFYSYDCGIVVATNKELPNSTYTLGNNTSFDINYYTRFSGEITLKN